jgi:hypothetical protein
VQNELRHRNQRSRNQIEVVENKLNCTLSNPLLGMYQYFLGKQNWASYVHYKNHPIIEKLYTAKEESLALLQTFLAYTEEKKCTEVFFASHGGLDAQRRAWLVIQQLVTTLFTRYSRHLSKRYILLLACAL